MQLFGNGNDMKWSPVTLILDAFWMQDLASWGEYDYDGGSDLNDMGGAC